MHQLEPCGKFSCVFSYVVLHLAHVFVALVDARGASPILAFSETDETSLCVLASKKSRKDFCLRVRVHVHVRVHVLVRVYTYTYTYTSYEDRYEGSYFRTFVLSYFRTKVLS